MGRSPAPAISRPGWVARGLACLALAGVACAPRPGTRGGEVVVVESVAGGQAAHRAGLREGDVLAVASLPELASLARRSAAGEAVRVERVLPAPLHFTLPKAEWGLEARPFLPREDERAHADARTAFLARRPEEAERRWGSLAVRRAAAGDPAGVAYFHLQRGRALLGARRLETARAAFEAAAVAGRSAARGTETWVREASGDILAQANQHAPAAEAFASALALTPDGDQLARGALLQKRALAVFRLGRYAEAADPARRALALWEQGRARSAAGSATLLTLARIERNHGRYDEAVALVERALAAARSSDPQGAAEAAAIGELATIAFYRGQPEEQQRWAREALRLYEELGATGTGAGLVHMELGLAKGHRGDVAAADDHFRAALACFERDSPESVQVGWALIGLGSVQWIRGDLEGAEQTYRRSVRIREAIRAGSPDHAISLQYVGLVARARGDLEGAEQAFREALRILEVEGSLPQVRGQLLGDLGQVLAARGDFEDARTLLERAVRLAASSAPEGIDHALALYGLGEVRGRAGRWPEAEGAHHRALAIRSRLVPGSAAEADSLYALGVIERRSGRRAEAARTLGRAVAALEAQRARLGGTPEDRARFSATYAHVHKELLDLLLELGRDAEAFDVLERYRVGSLGAMLAQRDVRMDSALPAWLRRRREHLRREYDRVLGALAEIEVARAPRSEVEGLLDRLRGLRAERQGLLASLRDVQPELAALEDPRPPDLARSARLLGEGTLLLSFAVLPERTVLFVLPGGGSPALETHAIPVSEARLRRDVATLHDLLRSPRAPAQARAALLRRLHELYEMLLAPARRRLEGRRRLLVLPDGPLHLVPFGALVTTRTPRVRHLAEEHAVARAAGITLLASRPPRTSSGRAGVRLLAFGDPAPGPGGTRHDAAPPLPHARREVEALARLYGDEASVFVGTDASEARVKALAGQARLLHFACHGLADDRFPLDSYVALSPSAEGAAGDNGLLQAWEVCEQVRLDADLVALSACDTGLGAELGGAGLLGLTYAFQFAGARSVLASLWPVSDRSTAALMRTFHERLRAGESPVDALRRAQLGLLARPVPAEPSLSGRLRQLLARPRSEDLALDASHPYYWAAFELFGALG